MPSFAATITGLALIAHASAHVVMINIYGSNGVTGHAFGVNLEGKFPRRKGLPGDAGGDAGVFQTGTDNPSPPCGRTPELGPLDIPSWLSQAEGSGLPAAYSNMSVVVEVFQVNRDGGGPMSCQYSEDATATSWKDMTMILNQAGNFGIENQNRVNETVVMQFPSDATCTGGWTGTACIVRCRTGVNQRFGGCFAAKLSGSTEAQFAISSSASAAVVPHLAAVRASSFAFSEAQIDSLAKQVVLEMKQQGLVVAAGSSANCPTQATSAQGIVSGSSQKKKFDRMSESTDDEDTLSGNAPSSRVTPGTSTLTESESSDVTDKKTGKNHAGFALAIPASHGTPIDNLTPDAPKSPHVAENQEDKTHSGEVASHAGGANLDASDLDDLETAKADASASKNNTIADAASSKKRTSTCRPSKNKQVKHAKRHVQ